MLASERFSMIVKMVNDRKYISTKELALSLNVTETTIRRDCEELEKDGLVNRKEYQQVPPKVEYSLTQMGRDLEPVVKEIHNWILKYGFFIF